MAGELGEGGGGGGNNKESETETIRPITLPYSNTAYSRWETFKELFINGADVKVNTTAVGWKIRVILTITFTAFYVLVRHFITVESFISLRKTPAGAYATVKYSDLMPHF